MLKNFQTRKNHFSFVGCSENHPVFTGSSGAVARLITATSRHQLNDGFRSSMQKLVQQPSWHGYWVDNPNDTTIANGIDGRESLGLKEKDKKLHFIGLFLV